jgi:hypothetical protein
MNEQMMVKSKFQYFMDIWASHDTDKLADIIIPDVHAWLSTCKYTPDSSQHSLFGIRDLIDTIPRTDSFNSEITNFICCIQGNEARQYAEVACLAQNHDGGFFSFVATFANRWQCQTNRDWKIAEMRMDVTPVGGDLRELFEKEWLFEPELAILSGSVHLPCIFPEMDSPYLFPEPEKETEEDEIAACISRYFYGVDQLQFVHVKEVLSDRFEGGKYEYMTTQKFLRQRYRYQPHPYRVTGLDLDGAVATAKLESMLENFRPLYFGLKREGHEWKIVSIKEVRHAEN